ncbi:MAG: M48 family metallopeptidase [Bdellovibrionales bacterium]|nr:M48 family metallopeptidase [Bdellovibrionales bacterium]
MQILNLNGRQVYLSRKSHRRTIRVSIRPNGQIHVTTGKMTSQSEIKIFLSQHSNWLEDSLFAFRSLRQKYPPKRFIQGEGFLYLGKYRFLNFSPKESIKNPTFKVSELELECSIPQAEWNSSFYVLSQYQIRSYLLGFFQSEGRRIIGDRVHFYSERMNLRPAFLSFRSQRTRWGSCTTMGNISLNWRLIGAPPEVLDYVVIHELAHLRYPNHSRLFWSLVEEYCDKYRYCRKWLRKNFYEFDFLSEKSEIHPDMDV